jgi:hypothetical protein
MRTERIARSGLRRRAASGEEMEKLAKEVMAQPPAVLERMKKVLGN